MVGGDGPEAVTRSGALLARIGRVDVPLQAALRAFIGPRMAWFAPDEPAVVGAGETRTIEAVGEERFEEIRRRGNDLFDSLVVESDDAVPQAAHPRLLGGFSFHDAPRPGPPWAGFPGAQFILPRVQLTRVDGQTWLTVTATESASEPDLATAFERARNALRDAPTSESPPPGLTDLQRSPDRVGWREQVESALTEIEAGTIEKVVLAQTLSAQLRGPFRLADTLGRLADTYPDCHRFAVDPGLGAAFFGATPERLVRQRDGRVETDALAGSIGRGGTAAEDDRLSSALESSRKARQEHAVVVDAVHEQLATVADDIDVGDRTVRKLSNVQHLDTPITATLRQPTHVLEVVAALHPTPAVGGRPPGAAKRLISSTERFDRGWYAAPVGWFDAAGEGTFAVGIRSAVATRDRATLFAGNGIVAGSDPDEEWDELQLKYRPILDQLR